MGYKIFKGGLTLSIIHVRIDDRLIHGQVAAFWCNSLKVDRIMIADDEVANNSIQKSVLRLAAPPGVSTSIITKEQAAENIKAGKYENQRVFLIFKSPKDDYDLIQLGVDLKVINVGNMAHREGTVQIKRNIKVSQEDVEYFLKLRDMGIKLTAKMVPADSETDFMDYLKKVLN